ncbi:MAG: ubiquinol-cytochrome c reductase iron-sulfur subunit [Bryobacteraceae bacterium]
MRWFRRSDTPLWQEEFSVFNAGENYVNRRQFTKFLTLTSLGMFVGNLWILARGRFKSPREAPPPVVAARAGEIPVGGVKLFPFAGGQCILVRIAEDTYVAYSQKCTHLSCAVFYARESNRLECPCHEGYFDVRDGSVLQGPPRRPLPRVELQRRGRDLVAVALKEGA